jgi:methyl-accepting chemotaxis protein
VARHVILLVQRGDLIGVAVFEKTFGSLLTEVAEANTSATALMTLEHVVIEATDQPLFANLSGVVKRDTTGYVKARHGEAHLSVSSIMLHDNDAKPLGIFVVAKDNSKAYAKDTRITLLAIAISLAVFLLCVGFLWHYIRNASAARPHGRVMNRVQCNGIFLNARPFITCKTRSASPAHHSTMLARIAEIILAIQQSTESIADAAQKMANSGLLTRVRQRNLPPRTRWQPPWKKPPPAFRDRQQCQVGQRSRPAGSARYRTLAGAMHKHSPRGNVAKLIRNASDNVGLLDDSSKKIGGIVQVIKEIADQTNLWHSRRH